jgi:nucleotide-binding universal stress UspA family protein
MTVVVGYVPTETGYLAVTEALRAARALQVPVVIVNVVGEAGFTAPTSAEDRDLETLIVMGLHRRSPVSKALLGSTAQSVMLTATCPVLTVRA